MQIKVLKELFSICKVTSIDSELLNSKNVFISKTEDEISIVCEKSKAPKNHITVNDNWKCLKICGILDFSLVGIISNISTILAKEGISIFVVSTYNTDYILIREKNLKKSIEALRNNQYIVK